jgi:hypothetical protein
LSSAASAIGCATCGQGNPTDPYYWLDALEAYDPVNDSWSTKSPMPTARFGEHARASARVLTEALAIAGAGLAVGLPSASD